MFQVKHKDQELVLCLVMATLEALFVVSASAPSNLRIVTIVPKDARHCDVSASEPRGLSYLLDERSFFSC